MGKYIIELKQGETAYKTVDSNGTPLIQLLAPIPYTEPDLEQVRKEAYENGWKEAEDHYEKGYSDGYDTGLSDAWEAATKIANIPYGEEEKVFGSGGWTFIINHTASEAIEKLKAYEQEKYAEIKVGDEVEGDEDGQRGVVIDSRFENSQVAVLTGNSKVYSWWSKCAIHKTGRHFPEIAEVMQKMKEEE